jgi:hypothetical protein
MNRPFRLGAERRRSEPNGLIDLFPQQIRTAIVPRVLLQHVHHPAQ